MADENDLQIPPPRPSAVDTSVLDRIIAQQPAMAPASAATPGPTALSRYLSQQAIRDLPDIGPAPVVAPLPDVVGVDRWGTEAIPKPGDSGYDAYKTAMDEHDRSLKSVADYLTVSHALAARQEQLQTNSDAAEWLGAAHQIDPTSPTYEKDHADLLAKYPRAAQNAAVKDIMTLQHGARETYLSNARHGGAAEFSGPVVDAYHQKFDETNDATAARAYATQVHAALTSGHITDADLWYNGEGEDNHSPLLNDDGSLNFDAVLEQNQKATAEAANTQRGQKAESASVNEAKAALGPISSRMNSIEKQLGGAPEPSDAEYQTYQNLKTIHDHYTDLLASAIKPKADGATGATGATAAAAPVTSVESLLIHKKRP